ncbi:MAG: hypothetical protein OXN89_25000 [Bryobacterales bacterium]|nr:hypothetical protein [Bryobacterales bacterium]
MVRALFLVMSLLLAGSAHGADCFGKIEFKDTEYGHNVVSSWSFWRKPITAAQAAHIKKATVVYLAVPWDYQEVDGAWLEASAAGIRWRDIQVLPMRPVQRKHPERAYIYELFLDGRRGPELVHEAVLLVSPSEKMYPKMIPHKRRRFVTETPIEIAAPKRAPDQDWDVRLVITKHWRLGGRPKPRIAKFYRDRGKPEGFNNFRNDWRVALCTAAEERR